MRCCCRSGTRYWRSTDRVLVSARVGGIIPGIIFLPAERMRSTRSVGAKIPVSVCVCVFLRNYHVH